MMECNKDEALRAKMIAEQKLLAKDTKGAKKFALKAQSLFPELDGIEQLHEVIDLHIAGERRVNKEMDYYAILNADPVADDKFLKKQYMRLALALHPDKNKSVGAAEAFQMLSQAWEVLSSKEKRSAYDLKLGAGALYQRVSFPSSSGSSDASNFRNTTAAANPVQVPRPQRPPAAPSSSNIGANVPLFPSHHNPTTAASTQFPAAPQQAHNAVHEPPAQPQRNPAMPAHPFHPRRNARPNVAPSSSRPDTFWTVCKECRMLYEYRKKFLNLVLLCPNCEKAFTATEVPAPNGSRFPQHHRGVFAATTGTSDIPAQPLGLLKLPHPVKV